VTRYPCRRCDWTPTGDQQRDQLADHATDSGHPLCVVCGLSLDRTETACCAMCVGQTRRDLYRIVDLYALLPDELGHATASPLDPMGRHHGDENPLPGGQILPLLAGGSRGLTQITGAPTTAGVRDYSHEADEHHSDPQSVAFELSRWEDHWRHIKGQPAADTAPTVTHCSDYLLKTLPWAASNDDAFQGFADDLTTLRGRLERVTGNDEPRAETGAPFFGCGHDLRRPWTDEGLADEWRCPRCKTVYEAPHYWLAVRAHLEKAKKAKPREEPA
jgi:hypothetical protein